MLPIPLLSTLRYPSLSAIEPSREFAILAPAADEVLNVPPNGTTNLSLRYVVRGFTGRLCLTLTRGQLQFYRGPVLHRDASLLKHYAKGCFDAGQPITLQGLRQGMYALAADLRDGGDAVSMTHSPIFFAVAEQSADAFEPTYEWQEVQEGQSVPSGLDVRLSLDGTHKTLARILPTWRLQVYTRGLGFLFARRASLKFQLEGCELDPESVATAVYDHEAHRGLHVEPQPEPRASSALMVVDT